MSKSGHRHRLILYTYLLKRWWQATLAIGLVLLVLAAGLGGLPLLLPQYPFMWVEDWKLWLVAGAGGFAILITLLLVIISKSAYVQPFENHIRLVTPFMHINISYRRFRRIYGDELQRLFPLKKAKGWRRDTLEALAGRTVCIIDMTAFPLPRWVLHQFLCPLFFPDRTARLALLVPDWMALSTEVDSLQFEYLGSLHPKLEQNSDSSPLAGNKNPPK